ncbi:putative phosphate-repressible Na+/phosphate cotransporter Pho89 [Cercophora newfieldiana]|uniref:Phosphate transporter n=1 Tax=Cercophora newfieldiana TaxID=92897 RepID=A0AA39YFU0_9PEZI|nr:putative phosphate-repressible Na+/phosphate cotransporter Pho89 [Cercophora newfieldiana]
MGVLHQYDYLFAIGTIFAFFDAYFLGANDVANSWATSVSARSLTYVQAMCIAAVMELAGCIGVGGHVASTIKNNIVDVDAFAGTPSLLMLGMVCTVVASSVWLGFATKIGFPVSTTHTVIGGIVGFGIAAIGADGVKWIPEGKGVDAINGGVVSVFASWLIAPCLAGVFASILFTTTKYLVLLRKDPVKRAFFLIPFYFGMTASLIATLLLTKGGSIKSTLSEGGNAGVIVGVGVAVALIIAVFWLPWLWRVMIHQDWELTYMHIPLGPLLLRRGEVPPRPEGTESGIRDYYADHLTLEELQAKRAAPGTATANADPEITMVSQEKTTDVEEVKAVAPKSSPAYKSLIGPKPAGSNFSPRGLFWWLKFALLQGVDHDIVQLQKNKQDRLAGDLELAHAGAAHYDNNVEHMYRYLQMMTAAAASFTHGANDAANAVGPYSTVYAIWNSGELSGAKTEVPMWILGFLGASMVIGLWTYGHKIMVNLGNRITLISPTRGFSCELGSTITIIVATRFGLPISTTQCITGATVGVGLCNGDWRTINWRMVAWIYFGWIVTVPCAGLISGCLMGIIINAPRWGIQ